MGLCAISIIILGQMERDIVKIIREELEAMLQLIDAGGREANA